MDRDMRLNDTYTIVDRIGSGGGGVVYKAYHERLQTYVVVKQIKEKVKGVLDGRAEADILKRIKHTYLPRVYDFLEIDGEIYTVMDYVPGKSLDKVLKEEGYFPPKQVLKWAFQLAEALDYLHRQEPPVIHSDIKPSNIMLTPQGDICLIDFNISLAFDSSRRTSTGTSGGYSPPEQYRSLGSYRNVSKDTEGTGETATMMSLEMEEEETQTAQEIRAVIGRGVDERSDIYSLGATLYHLLTGARPDRDFEKIIPIDQYPLDMGEGFTVILKKMMQLRPEDRYQNGSELLEAFRHIYELDGEYRAYRAKRRGLKLAAAALFAAGAALIGSGAAVRYRELSTAYNRSVEAASQAVENGDFDTAEEYLERAENIFRERIDVYGQEALRLYQMGDYEGCVQYAADILKNPPYRVENENDVYALADIYYIIGHAYMELEDYPNAAWNLEQALRYNQDNSVYFRDYAISLAKEGNTEGAEKALKDAVELGLGEDSIYMVQGEIAFAKNELEDAQDYLDKTLAVSTDEDLRRRAVLLYDDIYRKKGEDYLDEEIAFLEQEESRASGSSTALNLTERLADAYAKKAETDPENGQEYYQKALEKFLFLQEGGYSTRQMMENIAIVYQALGEYDQAEEMLFAMAEDYPDSYISYKRLAYLEAERQQEKENPERDYSKMKEYYDQAKELYGDQNTDQEMQMLDNLMQDLKDGNWL